MLGLYGHTKKQANVALLKDRRRQTPCLVCRVKRTCDIGAGKRRDRVEQMLSNPTGVSHIVMSSHAVR